MKEHICIDKVRKDLLNRNPEFKAVYFELSTLESRTHGISNKEFKTGQAIEIAYEHKKRNGGVETKYRKSFIGHTYCPFCGKKYE